MKKTGVTGSEAVRQFALANGFVLARHKKHLVFKRGAHTVTVSKSPRCSHALQNAMKDLKRVIALCEKLSPSVLQVP